jgi:DNA adenine methylase
MLATETQLDYRSFPPTKYMGSKYRLLPLLDSVFKNLPRFETSLDAFSGSACVSFLLKTLRKSVTSNDYLQFCYHIANGVIANNEDRISAREFDELVETKSKHDTLVSDTFKGLYFEEKDLQFLDNVSINIRKVFADEPTKASLALAALARACIKRQPRGIFAYTGNRYDDGRKDFRLTIKEHFRNCLSEYDKVIFNNDQKNAATCIDIFDYDSTDFDVVYIDTPYHTSLADNDYPRRYHFVEGLMSYWAHVKIDYSTKTRKFPFKKTMFDSHSKVTSAFETLFKKFSGSTLVISYSSTSTPSFEDMQLLLKKAGKRVEIHSSDHVYSFGTQKKNIENNRVKEFVFVGY